MSTVDIILNKRRYTINCEDGQEPHLEQLAKELDSRVQKLSTTVGSGTDSRLLVMTSLILCDELHQMKTSLADFKNQIETKASAQAMDKVEAMIAKTLDQLVGRIETLALQMEML